MVEYKSKRYTKSVGFVIRSHKKGGQKVYEGIIMDRYTGKHIWHTGLLDDIVNCAIKTVEMAILLSDEIEAKRLEQKAQKEAREKAYQEYLEKNGIFK